MTRPVTLGVGGAVFHPSQNQKLTLNGPVTGPGGFTVIWDAYSVVLGSALNNFSGNITIGGSDSLGSGSTAIVQLGADNAIPAGNGMGNVVFASAAGKQGLLDLNGHNAQVNGLVAPANTNAFVDNKTGTGSYTLTVGAGNTNSIFGGVINDTTGTINLAKTGTGTFTLTGSNTYAGGTFVSAGTLALSAYGSIATTPLIAVAGNAVFDVSGLTNTFALNAGQTFSNAAAATGIVCGNFNDAVGTNCFSFTNGTPALLVTNGTFTLAATTVFKLNNLGSALLPGSYKIIARATSGSAGSVAGNLPALNVNGGGILAGANAALQISGNELYLVVSNISTTTALTLTTGGNPSTAGNTLIFTAIVQTNSIAAGNAASNFVFKVDGVAVATNPVTGGQATFTNSTLAAGSHTITAEFRGDTIYAPSTNSVAQTVNPATPPVIGNIWLSGTNVIITGTNGVGAGNYYVLAATNLSTPMTGWTVLATNQFGGGGSVNCTNPQNPNSPQTFYRLRLP